MLFKVGRTTGGELVAYTDAQETQIERVKFIMLEGECLALLPDQKCGQMMIGSYQHVGQHGPAAKSLMKRPHALPYQFAKLKKELEGRGYVLRVIRPWSCKGTFRELAPDYSPKNDPWGYAMALAFDIGAACYSRGLWEGVRALDFSPGAGGCEFDDPYTRRRLMRMSEKRLIKLARFTARLLRLLDAAGRSY